MTFEYSCLYLLRQRNKYTIKIKQMTNYTITYNGNCTRGKFISQNRSALIMAENANQAIIHFFVSFMNGDCFPQEDGSVHDEQGREVMAAGDDCVEYDGGRFTAIPIQEN